MVKSTVSVSEKQKFIDQQSAELRRLELSIHALNWAFELSDEPVYMLVAEQIYKLANGPSD